MNSDSKMGVAKVHSDHDPQTLHARPESCLVLELFKEEETLPQIASRHGVHPNLLRKWKAQALEGLPNLFTDDEQDKRVLEAEHQRQLDELYGEIGRLTTQLAWLKKKSGLEPGPR